MAEPMFRIIASTRQPGTCRSSSCGARITWAKTFPNQKAMPLHGEPVALKTEHDNEHGLIEFIASADSHWAHCRMRRTSESADDVTHRASRLRSRQRPRHRNPARPHLCLGPDAAKRQDHWPEAPPNISKAFSKLAQLGFLRDVGGRYQVVEGMKVHIVEA